MTKDLLSGNGPEASPAAEGELHELWRVVSVDGSTRVFQTKPAVDSRGGRRMSSRRVTACPLDSFSGAPARGLFEESESGLPPLVTEMESGAHSQRDAEMSVELTSVTQAWATLSPGIRGAVMALIRAASRGRPTRPAAAPHRE